jgi:predicted metallopeptidase
MPTSLAYHWDRHSPPPRLGIRLSNRRPIRVPEAPAWLDTGSPDRPFDFSAAMQALCADVIPRTPDLGHIDLSRVLFTVNLARNGRRHGLQARVTPLRFQGGALVSRLRDTAYQVQRVVVDGREILYLVTFCMPRFLNRDFDDKLLTVFHELYHISPTFDGDLRRHAGRYCAHTGSQKKYDAHMAVLAKRYLKNEADPAKSAFLRLSFGQLCRRHGSVVGLHLPRPKLIPVSLSRHEAARTSAP